MHFASELGISMSTIHLCRQKVRQITNLYKVCVTSTARNDRLVQGVDDSSDVLLVFAVQGASLAGSHTENYMVNRAPDDQQDDADQQGRSDSPDVLTSCDRQRRKRKANDDRGQGRCLTEKPNGRDACHRVGMGRNDKPGVRDRDTVVVEKNALLCAHCCQLSGDRVPCYSPTWAVRMEVPGLLWWPSWEGRAIDAQAASDLAVAEFRAKWGGVPVRVTSVCEVRS